MPPLDEEQHLLLRRVLGERVRVMAFIHSIVRRRDLAEDIFQDLCVLVLQKREELGEVRYLSRWLRVAARQLAMNELRRHANRSILLGDKIDELMEPHWRELDRIRDLGRGDALEVCLKSLSGTEMELINGRYLEQLSCPEQASKLGRPVCSLYTSFSRIHKKLAECIVRRLSRTELIHG
jgi:RNA polymerase sigma factor (sigma-70 family)